MTLHIWLDSKTYYDPDGLTLQNPVRTCPMCCRTSNGVKAGKTLKPFTADSPLLSPLWQQRKSQHERELLTIPRTTELFSNQVPHFHQFNRAERASAHMHRDKQTKAHLHSQPNPMGMASSFVHGRQSKEIILVVSSLFISTESFS